MRLPLPITMRDVGSAASCSSKRVKSEAVTLTGLLAPSSASWARREVASWSRESSPGGRSMSSSSNLRARATHSGMVVDPAVAA